MPSPSLSLKRTIVSNHLMNVPVQWLVTGHVSQYSPQPYVASRVGFNFFAMTSFKIPLESSMMCGIFTVKLRSKQRQFFFLWDRLGFRRHSQATQYSTCNRCDERVRATTKTTTHQQRLNRERFVSTVYLTLACPSW